MYNFADKALRRVSPIYERSHYMQSFYKATGEPFDILRPYFEKLREQSFNTQVTWGIDYREEMYSLPHRTDLTLEERRELLKIRGMSHFPINPARLEKYIDDNFNFKTYLSEREAGYIRLIFNYTTPESWSQTISWLLDEKPAHLTLISRYEIIITPGGGGEDPTDIDKEEPPVPKDDEDKKNFRRIFAGVGNIFAGDINVDIKKPSHEIKKLYSGLGEIFCGELSVGLKKPSHVLKKIYAGTAHIVEGTISINDIPPYPPPKPFNEKLSLYAGVGNIFSGNVSIDIKKEPPNLIKKLYAGSALLVEGLVEINDVPPLPPPKPFEEEKKIYAGVGNVFSGHVFIDTKKNPPNLIKKLYAGTALLVEGSITINDIPPLPPPAPFEEEKKLYAGVGQVLDGNIFVDMKKPATDTRQNLYAGIGNIFSGNIFLENKKPSHVLKRIYAGSTLIVDGAIEINDVPPLPAPEPFEENQKLFAGSALVVSGEITIG